MLFLLTIIAMSSILIIVSLGLAIIFGVMKVANLSHGEFIMIGAYACYVIMNVFEINFLIALPIGFIVSGLVGLLTYIVLIKHVVKSGLLAPLLITWATSIIFQEIAKLVFGPRFQNIGNPFPERLLILGQAFPVYYLIVIGVNIAILLIVIFIYTKTRFGIICRATSEDYVSAECMGINVDRIYAYAFVLGSGLAGLAGVLLAPIVNVSPMMGIYYVIKSFFVVIIGGIGNILGVCASGALIGGGEQVLSNFMERSISEIMLMFLMIAVLIIRPKGLFKNK